MPQAESTPPRKSTSFGGRYSRPPFRKIAPQVSSVSPRTRATKSLVSSRAPGAEPEGGGALCVGAEGASPPCSETRTSRGLRPRNQLIASTAISPTPPSLNPPPRPPVETDSRSSTLLLPRMSPQRIGPPFSFDPGKALQRPSPLYKVPAVAAGRRLAVRMATCRSAARACSCSAAAKTACTCCSSIRAVRSGRTRTWAPGRFPRGSPTPARKRSPVRQAGGKMVEAWAFEGDADAAAIRSNTFSIEWPRGSGRFQDFPEVDRAEWFSLDDARRKILRGQTPLLEELASKF